MTWHMVTSELDENDAWRYAIEVNAVRHAMGHVPWRWKVERRGGAHWVYRWFDDGESDDGGEGEPHSRPAVGHPT